MPRSGDLTTTNSPSKTANELDKPVLQQNVGFDLKPRGEKMKRDHISLPHFQTGGAITSDTDQDIKTYAYSF